MGDEEFYRWQEEQSFNEYLEEYLEYCALFEKITPRVIEKILAKQDAEKAAINDPWESANNPNPTVDLRDVFIEYLRNNPDIISERGRPKGSGRWTNQEEFEQEIVSNLRFYRRSYWGNITKKQVAGRMEVSIDTLNFYFRKFGISWSEIRKRQ